MRERERSGRGGRDTRRHKSYQVYIFLRFFFPCFVLSWLPSYCVRGSDILKLIVIIKVMITMIAMVITSAMIITTSSTIIIARIIMMIMTKMIIQISVVILLITYQLLIGFVRLSAGSQQRETAPTIPRDRSYVTQ